MVLHTVERLFFFFFPLFIFFKLARFWLGVDRFLRVPKLLPLEGMAILGSLSSAGFWPIKNHGEVFFYKERTFVH